MSHTTQRARKARVLLTNPQPLATNVTAMAIDPKTYAEIGERTLEAGTVVRQEIRPDVPASLGYVIVQTLPSHRRYELESDRLAEALFQ